MNIRIGNGYDVHAFAPNLDFWLGGIKIDYELGCMAHSDGDTLIHAICDALLGALALGDIGVHFPDNAEEFKGIDSKILLARVMTLIENKGYQIVNIDAVVCLQEPKIKNKLPEMRKVLCPILHIDDDQLSLKATTTEKLGFVGRSEGVAAYVVALLIRNV